MNKFKHWSLVHCRNVVDNGYYANKTDYSDYEMEIAQRIQDIHLARFNAIDREDAPVKEPVLTVQLWNKVWNKWRYIGDNLMPVCPF